MAPQFVAVAIFLSTPSARRATSKSWPRILITFHFYPRPPRGGRPHCAKMDLGYKTFLSTPSARRATFFHKPYKLRIPDFYPRPPRGGRRPQKSQRRNHQLISIHALREEGDHTAGKYNPVRAKFLSTPSARRATNTFYYIDGAESDFYPRPPRGGRRASSASRQFCG